MPKKKVPKNAKNTVNTGTKRENVGFGGGGGVPYIYIYISLSQDLKEINDVMDFSA